MQTLSIPAMAFQVLFGALEDLSRNRLPFKVARKVNRIRNSVTEYYQPWLDELRPIAEPFVDKDGNVPANHPQIAEFNARAEYLFVQDVEIQTEVLTEEEVDWIESREDCSVAPFSLEVLEELGLIQKPQQEA